MIAFQQASSQKTNWPIFLCLGGCLWGWLFAFPAVRCARGADWPQWLGSQRDSVWREDGIVDHIPSSGLKVQWRAPIAGGYAGPAVAENRVYVMDYVTDGDQSNDPDKRNVLQGSERVLCLNASNGELLWKYEYACPYEISYAAGPRATPTVQGNRVYTLGAEGHLHCLDALSGEVVWSHDFKSQYGAKTPMWGFCGHPLVDGDRLICLVGSHGKLVMAFDRETGKELWRGLDGDEIGYSADTN